jgi:hypothetical protein
MMNYLPLTPFFPQVRLILQLLDPDPNPGANRIRIQNIDYKNYVFTHHPRLTVSVKYDLPVVAGMGGAAGCDPDHPAGGSCRLARPLLLQAAQERGRGRR